MLEIDKAIFDQNLLLTQAYCELQLKKAYKNASSILRSFNPVYDGKELFSFKLRSINTGHDGDHKFSTEWGLDPTENVFLYDELFEKQLKHKSEIIEEAAQSEYRGKILFAEIGSVICDGVSEFESDGFIDYYDCPPIDTWFYITKNDDRNVLFAWIPEPFTKNVNYGIDANALAILSWYREGRSENNSWHDENLGKAIYKQE